MFKFGGGHDYSNSYRYEPYYPTTYARKIPVPISLEDPVEKRNDQHVQKARVIPEHDSVKPTLPKINVTPSTDVLRKKSSGIVWGQNTEVPDFNLDSVAGGGDDDFPNENIRVPQGAVHVAVVGDTGSGKTNRILSMLLTSMVNDWDRLVIIAKVLDERKYDYLKKKYKDRELVDPKTGQPSKYPALMMFDNLKDVPNPLVFKENQDTAPFRTVVIIDDMMSESEAKQAGLKGYFYFGRKSRMSVYYLAQNFFGMPRAMRTQCKYIMYWPPNLTDDVVRVSGCYRGKPQWKLTRELWMKCYSIATNKKHGFLFIDCRATSPVTYLRDGLNNYFPFLLDYSRE